MLYIYSKKTLNFKLIILNNNEIIWQIKNCIDIYDIFCLIYICKKFNKQYKSVFSNEDLETFNFEYHYYNKEVYNYFINILYNHFSNNNNKTIFIKIKHKYEAYIIYILSKILGYEYKIEFNYKSKRLNIKRFFYPYFIKLNNNVS